MSVLVELTIFPTDKGSSVSSYVARVVKVIRECGLSSQLGPMGTSIEGEWDQVMSVVTKCYRELEKDCDRIYMVMKADCRKGAVDRLNGKIKSVESKL
ncbi:MTH1187 family thiamine-binding protein [Maridesulfovibrio zosterae]|uniref:MTH1187 family thiamine-binding protein n=1 Tax=Maridesulfovibrio zosterae TaxID=82171 RepID=UPI000422C061|nr:MTH1187 family thiamine-binding protein [Maridesulfovibrio zosterae]